MDQASERIEQSISKSAEGLKQDLLGFPKAKTRLVGHVFVPAHAVHNGVDSQQRKIARDMWGYELFLHPVPSG